MAKRSKEEQRAADRHQGRFLIRPEQNLGYEEMAANIDSRIERSVGTANDPAVLLGYTDLVTNKDRSVFRPDYGPDD